MANGENGDSEHEFADLVKGQVGQAILIRVIRLDSRVRGLEKEFKQFHAETAEYRKNTVTVEAFKPVRLIVFSFCGLVLSGFVGALIALVIQSPGK